jgi:tetratricopeptide (TPR) repeat protein
MYNLLLSLAAGLAIALAVRFGAGVGWVGAVVPGLIAAVAAYLVLVRRSFRQLEALFEAAQRELQANHFEKALATMERGFALAPWQFLMASQIHAQLGVLHYIRKDFAKALPHLKKSFSKHWIARGMLAVQLWRQKERPASLKAFEAAVASNKKEGLLWCVYAWVLDKDGEHEEAVKVLGRGAATNPSDEKLKAAFQALQNDKKLKLGKLYDQQWYQFHLEPVPTQLLGGGMPRGARRAIYGKR